MTTLTEWHRRVALDIAQAFPLAPPTTAKALEESECSGMTPGPVVIDTADHVLHGPSGEEWLVARVKDSHLYPCGWPPSRAALSDCTLVKKATPAQREMLLRELAAGQSEHATWAREALPPESPTEYAQRRARENDQRAMALQVQGLATGEVR